MVLSLSLLFSESSASEKENPDKKKKLQPSFSVSFIYVWKYYPVKESCCCKRKQANSWTPLVIEEMMIPHMNTKKPSRTIGEKSTKKSPNTDTFYAMRLANFYPFEVENFNCKAGKVHL